MLSWETLENAIVVAVKAASGYSTGSVAWADQGKTAPSGDYVLLRLGDIPPDATAVPSQTTAYSATPAGAELTHTYRHAREFFLSIQVFTATVRGDASARAIAAKIQNNFSLSSVREALRAAGLGLLHAGGVKVIPNPLKGTRFEGRALLEPRFYILDTVTETTTFIQTVNPPLDYTQPPYGDPDTIDI